MAIPDIERARWLKAVVLHDALKDASRETLLAITPDVWDVPALLHGPAAAVRAEQDGEVDRGILDAVRYHSVGYRGWERVGHVLYLADFLEAGRPYHTDEHDDLLERVPRELESVLLSVAAERVAGTVSHGKPLLPETTEFWNGLARGS
jgi:HD superfamily phosphohydrolase YqeK